MAMKKKLCKWRKCRVEFEPKREWQKFHSNKCRIAFQSENNAKMIREYKRIKEEQRAAS